MEGTSFFTPTCFPGAMSCENTDINKSELRARYRKARQDIADELRMQNDQIIGTQIEAFTSLMKASRIAGYLAFDGEPNITAALAGMNAGRAEVCLPVISASIEEPSMIFRRWLSQDHNAGLEKNPYGIEEPVIGEEVEPPELDIIFMPLVAWDEDGGRLGMGAGYYDRILADVAGDSTPLRIGIAYEVQCANQLPMNDNDVPLHGVITEKGLIDFNELLAVQERT